MTDPPFAGEVPEVLDTLETVAAAILTRDGRIVETNRGFAHLVEASEHATPEDASRLFLQPRFEGLAEATTGTWERLHEGLLHLGDPEDEEAASLTGTVHGRGNRLVVFAEQETAGDRKVRDKVLALNRELAETQREMNRELAARRRAERRLERKTEALERSNEQLEEFAYIVSHDLQEPLRTVTSYLQLLERSAGEALGPELAEHVDNAVEGAKRMQTMIEGLLDYARLASDPVEPEPVALADVVEDVLDGLHVRIEETGADVHADDLPTVLGDETQIGHLYQNLIANALDHAGPQPTIELGFEGVHEGKARLYVADDGPGIDPEHRDELFDLFESGTGESTGIGLAVARRVVERYGGTIGVDAASGGAKFVFELPVPSDDADGQG